MGPRETLTPCGMATRRTQTGGSRRRPCRRSRASGGSQIRVIRLADDSSSAGPPFFLFAILLLYVSVSAYICLSLTLFPSLPLSLSLSLSHSLTLAYSRSLPLCGQIYNTLSVTVVSQGKCFNSLPVKKLSLPQSTPKTRDKH
jgi:hypothetical protein